MLYILMCAALISCNIFAMETVSDTKSQSNPEAQQVIDLYKSGKQEQALKKFRLHPCKCIWFIKRQHDHRDPEHEKFNELLKQLVDSYQQEFTDQDYLNAGCENKLNERLEGLDFSDLFLTKITLPMQSTENIYLESNRLQNIDPQLLPENLAYLDLNLNKLKRINLSRFHNLIILHLADNKLSSIQGLSSTLKEINLRGNEFSELPDLSALTNLVVFHVPNVRTFNQERLPKSLKMLWFVGTNQLEEIVISDMENLWYMQCQVLSKANRIDISDTALRSIGLMKIPQLQHLHLQGNQITSLNLEPHKNLTTVDVSNNPLESLTIPDNVAYLNLMNSSLTEDEKATLYAKVLNNNKVIQTAAAIFTSLMNLVYQLHQGIR